MLKLIGENGKSIIAEALQEYEYSHAKVYVYEEYEIPSLNYYYVDANQYSVKEFCDFVYNDLTELEHTNMAVLYTNLSDILKVLKINTFAEQIEKEGLARLVVVANKNVTVANHSTEK
jgi:hypothetical protein